MIRAQLKRLHSPDVDLQSYRPSDPTLFAFLLEASIGPVNEAGADLFSIYVCTPEWLRDHAGTDVAIFGRHLLIVFDYDLPAIQETISRYVTSCSGSSWNEVAERIGRMVAWEFEDYQAVQP